MAYEEQGCFLALHVAAECETLQSLTSCTSSISTSLDSLCYTGLESVSGMLGAEFGALTLPADDVFQKPTEPALNPRKILNGIVDENVDPVDFTWLLVRCDRDPHLVRQVLKSFCEQGRFHLRSIQNGIQQVNHDCILFHTVYFIIRKSPIVKILRISSFIRKALSHMASITSGPTGLSRGIGIQRWGMDPRAASPSAVPGGHSRNIVRCCAAILDRAGPRRFRHTQPTPSFDPYLDR